MEKWKDVKGFPGYQVSNTGKVRSNRPTGARKDTLEEYRELKPIIDNHGYSKVHLYYAPNQKKRRSVHRLVMETFKPDHSDDLSEIDHIDCNKQNNCVENLE